MLVLDTNLLSDYFNGTDSARSFLTEYEREEWAVPAIVLYETLMGAVYGYIQAPTNDVYHAVSSSMMVLEISERTAVEARNLQKALLSEGEPVEQLDALIAASAREHGGTFATADQRFWTDTVESELAIARYEPT